MFLFSLQTISGLRRAKRERERERERERRESREKQQEYNATEAEASIAPSARSSHPNTGEIVTPQHRRDRHHSRPIHPKPISFSTQSSSAPPFSPSFSFSTASHRSDLPMSNLITDLPFFSLPMSNPVTYLPMTNPVTSLSLPSSLHLIEFDEFFLVGFCFLCLSIEK